MDKKFEETWASYTPYVLSLLRIISGLLILQHGMGKHLKFPYVASYDGIATFSLPWFAGVFELVLGALVLLGLFTRPAAFILSGTMAFAYFIGHAPRGFFPILNNGNLAILYCFVFFYLSFAGGGPLSLDAILRKKS